MIELSGYVLETLREDGEFVLYRGVEGRSARSWCWRPSWHSPLSGASRGWSTPMRCGTSWTPPGRLDP